MCILCGRRMISLSEVYFLYILYSHRHTCIHIYSIHTHKHTHTRARLKKIGPVDPVFCCFPFLSFRLLSVSLCIFSLRPHFVAVTFANHVSGPPFSLCRFFILHIDFFLSLIIFLLCIVHSPCDYFLVCLIYILIFFIFHFLLNYSFN